MKGLTSFRPLVVVFIALGAFAGVAAPASAQYFG